MSIKLIKLITQEEIISNIEIENQKVKIKKPLLVVQVPDGEGDMSIGLLPWLLHVKEQEINIDIKNTLYIAEPVLELKNQYKELTGEIVIPSQDLLL